MLDKVSLKKGPQNISMTTSSSKMILIEKYTCSRSINVFDCMTNITSGGMEACNWPKSTYIYHSPFLSRNGRSDHYGKILNDRL